MDISSSFCVFYMNTTGLVDAFVFIILNFGDYEESLNCAFLIAFILIVLVKLLARDRSNLKSFPYFADNEDSLLIFVIDFIPQDDKVSSCSFEYSGFGVIGRELIYN